jgi:hypothetical protein
VTECLSPSVCVNHNSIQNKSPDPVLDFGAQAITCPFAHNRRWELTPSSRRLLFELR